MATKINIAKVRMRLTHFSHSRQTEFNEILRVLDPVLSQLFLSGYGTMACVGGRGRRKMFKGRQFDQSVILLCVRWYLAYNLSLRNLRR